MTRDREYRVQAILQDISQFAVTAKRVADRGYQVFTDPENDDQRRIARSLIVDLSTAADRLPQTYRDFHPEVDWRGIRAARNFIAHDYDGTDEDVLWRAISIEFPKIAKSLLG